MSLLATGVYANPTQPLWTPFGTGGGATGPTGPAGSSGSTGPTGPSGGGGAVATQTLFGAFGQGATEGVVPTTGSYFNRVLNAGFPFLSGSNSVSIPGMSISANVITLPVGTYSVKGAVPAFGIGRHKAILYNRNTSNIELLGQSAYSDAAGQGEMCSLVQGGITVSNAPATYVLQQQCENIGGGLALGVPANFAGDAEVYSIITFDKIA